MAAARPAARYLTRWRGVLGLAAGLFAPPAAAQAPDALEFLGFRAGMTRAASDSAVHRFGGRLRCQPTREPRISACSAEVQPPEGGGLTVTLSLVDDRVGIALLSGGAPPERITGWYESLTARYGASPVRRQTGLESFQWIRQGQMLRLTVRREGGGLVASISLVDGALLDGLPPP